MGHARGASPRKLGINPTLLRIYLEGDSDSVRVRWDGQLSWNGWVAALGFSFQSPHVDITSRGEPQSPGSELVVSKYRQLD